MAGPSLWESKIPGRGRNNHTIISRLFILNKNALCDDQVPGTVAGPGDAVGTKWTRLPLCLQLRYQRRKTETKPGSDSQVTGDDTHHRKETTKGGRGLRSPGSVV